VHLQIVGDLLWAPVLFQQSDDVFPEVGGEVEAASFASPPGGCITVGQIGAILAIDELFVAFEFPTNGTGRALESSGNISFGPTAYAELGDVVAFVLRELVVSIHNASLSCRKLMRVVSQLSHLLARVLHLLLESAEWMGQRISDEIQLLESMRLMSSTGDDLSWIDARISEIRLMGAQVGIAEARYKLPREYADSLDRTDEYLKYYRVFSKFTHPSSWVINENKEKLESHEAFNWLFMKKTETYTVEILAHVAAYIDSRIKGNQSKEGAHGPAAAI
jgi:hypothetical protein